MTHLGLHTKIYFNIWYLGPVWYRFHRIVASSYSKLLRGDSEVQTARIRTGVQLERFQSWAWTVSVLRSWWGLRCFRMSTANCTGPSCSCILSTSRVISSRLSVKTAGEMLFQCSDIEFFKVFKNLYSKIFMVNLFVPVIVNSSYYYPIPSQEAEVNICAVTLYI